MKSFIGSAYRCVLLAVFLSAILTAGVVFAENLTVTLEAGDYRFGDRAGGALKIHMDDFGQVLVPGKPQLPARSFLIAIPPGARVLSVTVNAVGAAELPGTFRVMPTPAVAPLSDRPDLEAQCQQEWEQSYRQVYSSDTFYPKSAGEYQGTGALRKYEFVRVAYYPFAFAPLSGRLVYRPTLTVSIDYEPGLPAAEEALADTRADETAAELLVNFRQAQSWYAPTGAPRAALGSYDYVAITTAELAPALDSLVLWKEMIGHSVNVVTTEWIQVNYSGRDLPEQIRNFLIDKYLEWGIEYVLLAGNIDVLPMRVCYPDATNHGTDTDFCPPTDYYYADLTGEWDSDGDGYFGEYLQDDIDYVPEVYVGRIPWSDFAVLADYGRKVMYYEADRSAWKNRALLIGTFANFENQNLSGYPESDFAEMTEEMKNDMLAGWVYTTMYETEGIKPSDYACDIPVNASSVRDTWSAGRYAVVNWGGHGAPYGVARLVWDYDDGDGIPESDATQHELSTPFFMHNNYASTLDDAHPSITFQVSCNNAYPEQNNLARELIRNGAIGTVASTRIAWYTKGWDDETDGLCASMDYYFFDYLIGQEQTTGQALYNSKAFYAANFVFDFYRHVHNLYDFVLYGEPSLVRAGIDYACIDSDGDGVADPGQPALLCSADNCVDKDNPDQLDYDGDGYGDICDLCPGQAIPGNPTMMTGDVNADSTIASPDVIFLVNHVFKGGPPPVPTDMCGDVDCSGALTSVDILRLVNYVFKSAEPPCDACAMP